ncbi:MAG TPA: hypothetical protein VGD56_17195, partial [Gemmatirosa sp.]
DAVPDDVVSGDAPDLPANVPPDAASDVSADASSDAPAKRRRRRGGARRRGRGPDRDTVSDSGVPPNDDTDADPATWHGAPSDQPSS